MNCFWNNQLPTAYNVFISWNTYSNFTHTQYVIVYFFFFFYIAWWCIYNMREAPTLCRMRTWGSGLACMRSLGDWNLNWTLAGWVADCVVMAVVRLCGSVGRLIVLMVFVCVLRRYGCLTVSRESRIQAVRERQSWCWACCLYMRVCDIVETDGDDWIQHNERHASMLTGRKGRLLILRTLFQIIFSA